MVTADGVGSPIRLPRVLRDGGDDAAVDVLREYFTRNHVRTGYLRTGAVWDSWDPSGRRDADRDVFTADDLVAATLLSVEVPAQGALFLLGERRDELTSLLREVGDDRDLVEVDGAIAADGALGRLERALTEIHGVGRTTASKLLARKRPRLYPIYDRAVGLQLGLSAAHIEPIRVALRADDRALHHRLLALRAAAGLGAAVSPLRVLYVLGWMQAKKYVAAT